MVTHRKEWHTLRELVAMTWGVEVRQKLMSAPQSYEEMLTATTATDWDIANFFYVEATKKNWPAHILYLEANPGACIAMCLIQDRSKRWIWMAWGVQRSLDTVPPGVLLSKLYGPFVTLRDAVDVCKQYYKGHFGRLTTFTGLSPQGVNEGFIEAGRDIEAFIATARTWKRAPRKKLVA